MPIERNPGPGAVPSPAERLPLTKRVFRGIFRLFLGGGRSQGLNPQTLEILLDYAEDVRAKRQAALLRELQAHLDEERNREEN